MAPQVQKTLDQKDANDIDYTEFVRLLEQRRTEIMERARATRSHLDEQLDASAGPGDEADISVMDHGADYFLKLQDNERRELVEIRNALDRIRRGVYGTCESCSNEIASERLKRLPYARYCIECQASFEAGQRTRRPNLTPKL